MRDPLILALVPLAERGRRVVYKAEVMEGTNTGLVVTNKPEVPEALCEHYADRAKIENRIKYLTVALKAVRLNCHRFMALRSRPLMLGIERMHLETLRLRLAKFVGPTGGWCYSLTLLPHFRPLSNVSKACLRMRNPPRLHTFLRGAQV